MSAGSRGSECQLCDVPRYHYIIKWGDEGSLTFSTELGSKAV